MRWLARIFRKRTEQPEKVLLNPEGFDLWAGAARKGSVLWREVDTITVFKEDLLTEDLVCMEFIIGARNEVFEVNEEVAGFWEMVERIKEILPTSRQDWELSVVKPAFTRNATVIYRQRPPL
jgi:hypothetical protein